jgi:hypothetical protein
MLRENVELGERSYRLLAELQVAKPGALERSFRECFDEDLAVRVPGAYPEGRRCSGAGPG